MKYDHVILRDVDGKIRFPEELRISDKQAENLADWAFQVTAKDIGVKQLDCTFDEYDESTGIKKKRGSGRKWSLEEMKYVLLHHEDGDKVVGDALGRSNMSIYMAKADILARLDIWKNANQASIQGKTREEIVDLYLK